MELNSRQGLKIIKAEIKNFQGLDSKVIEINGKSIAVVGKNGGSKSSLMRAIQSPVNAKVIPQKAIKEGQEEAMVKLFIKGEREGEQVEYTYKVVFDSENQNGKVIVVDGDGNKITNKSLQRDIIGDISFDINQFIRLGFTDTGKKSLSGVKEQAEILKGFLTFEERKTLVNYDNRYKALYEQRADVNREIKRLEGLVKSFSKLTESEIKQYSVNKEQELLKKEKEFMDFSESILAYEKSEQLIENLTNKANEKRIIVKKEAGVKFFKEQVEKIANHNRFQESVSHLIYQSIESLLRYFETEMSDILNAKILLSGIEHEIKQTKDLLSSKGQKPDLDTLKQEIEDLRNHQENYKSLKEFFTWKKSLDENEKLSKSITAEIEEIVESKKQVFISSKMPVKGLSFDDDGVYYNGLPFDSDHHPSSTIISVGVKLAIAMNPYLKCIFIQDGSLLDKETFSKLLKFIEEKGYQLFIEMVDWDATTEVETKFAESFL